MSYLTSDECWIVVCITLAILIWLLKFIVKPYNMASKVNERGGLYPHTETPLTLSKPPSKIHLSLVIPAYNEEERLPPMLSATFNFLKSTPLCSKSNQVEVIVVSDGSTDETCSVVKRASAPDTLPPNTHLRLITLSQNRGKGAAIKLGMLAAKGDYVLMVDADGATDVNDAEKLMKVMQVSARARRQGDSCGRSETLACSCERRSCSIKTAVTTGLRAIGVVRWNRIGQARRLAESSSRVETAHERVALKSVFKTRIRERASRKNALLVASSEPRASRV